MTAPRPTLLVARSLLLLTAATSALQSWSAQAQESASPYTSGFRWDALRRVVGKIEPDPGSTSVYLAERYSYNGDGQLITVERGYLTSWMSDTVAPVSWSGFNIRETTSYQYDVVGNLSEERLVASGTVQRVTQMSSDPDDRPLCTAIRMNLSAIPATNSDACVLGTTGADGPDRITRTDYDMAGQVLKTRKAVGTPLVQDYVTYSYTPNGQRQSVIDANGNRAAYTYDGFDRLVAWSFPSAANGAVTATCNIGTITETGGIAGPSQTRNAGDDCEKYAYDRTSNRARFMKRDGRVLGYAFDAVNRVTVKTVPDACVIAAPACTTPPASATRDVYYAYDGRGLQTEARFDSLSGQGVSLTYDKAGRLTRSRTTMGGTTRQLDYAIDPDGNRTQMIFPDGVSFTYDYDGLDRMTAIRESGSTVVTSISYDNANRRSAMTGGVVTSYGYDAASRLATLTHDMASTARDVTFAFNSPSPGYNPADQLKARTIGNDAYAYTVFRNASEGYTANGLNQYVSRGGNTVSHDANGNTILDASTTYAYDAENRLVSAPGSVFPTLIYDPLGRLFETGGGSITTRFLYDGDALVAEYDGAGTVLKRYVHGPGTDEPLLWYEGSSLATRRHLRADNQGSIVAITDASGNSLVANAYDDWGGPRDSNLGRFQYTGQAWIPELGIYHYKARAYSPRLGRFLQTDPVGYDDRVNLYAYVANDPVNNRDPDGQELVAAAVGAFAGAVGGLGLQAVDDLVSGHFSGADSYAASAFGGAAGGAVFGLTGNATLAGATAGAVSEGGKALLRGEGVKIAIEKGAVGGALGAAGGRFGSRLSASGAGTIGRAAQQTSLGRAVARNEQMSNMMRGRLQAGQVQNPSMGTVYKMTAAGVTSGAAAAKLTGTATSAVNQQINKSCGVGETCR